MVDVNEIVEEILSALDVPMFYQYPEQFNDLPVVSFYNLSDTEGFRADNTEWSQSTAMQIDVWADRAVDAVEIGIKINDLMQKAGWIRSFARDMPKQAENQVCHRTMRFSKETYF